MVCDTRSQMSLQGRGKSRDGTCNILPSREHTVLEFVQAHFATFATGMYFLLLIVPSPLSRLRCILITRRPFCTGALPRRDWGVSE